MCDYVVGLLLCSNFFLVLCWFCFFFFQAEDGIRDLVRSRGLGDVYKRQVIVGLGLLAKVNGLGDLALLLSRLFGKDAAVMMACLLYTSDAADDLLCVDLGGRRIIKKKKTDNNTLYTTTKNNSITYTQYQHTTPHKTLYRQ